MTKLRWRLWIPVLLIPACSLSAFAGSHFDRVRELLSQGQRDEAIQELRRTVASAPKNVEAWQLLGDTYLLAGKVDSAAVVGRTLVDMNDDRSAGYVLLSRAELASKDPAGAYQTVQTGLAKTENRRLRGKENGAPILAQLGMVLLARDSTDQAVIAFSKAKEADPADLHANEGLGDAYMRRGVYTLAVTQYEKCVQIDSLQAPIYYKLAQALVKDRQYNEAARAYEKVVGLDTTNVAAMLELSEIYVASKYHVQALPLLKRVVETDPNSPKAWTLYMEALYRANRPAEARTAAEEVLKSDPSSARALRVLGFAQSELGDNAQAAETYLRLAQVDTLQIPDQKRLAKAYAQTSRDSLAAVVFEQVLAADSTQTDVYTDLGAVYMRLRRFDRAADVFEKRFTADSTAVGAYVNYGLSQMALQNWKLAYPALRRVVILRPEFVPGHVHLARCLVQMDSLKRATEEYELVVALADTVQGKYQSELAEAYGTIGLSHLLAKRYEQALKFLGNAIRLKDDNPQTHLWKAQTYALMNRREEAIQEYRQVLKLDPQNKDAQRDLKILAPQ